MPMDPIQSLTVTKVTAANRLRKSPVGVSTTRKCIKQWALVLKREGQTFYYTADGKEIRSDKYHPAILPKGSFYRWTCTEPGECLLIEFDALTEANTVFSFEVVDSGFFEHAFVKIEKSLHRQMPQTDVECKMLVYELLLTLCQTKSRQYVPKDKQNILKPALDYIFGNYYVTNITNDFLAGLCGVSTVYFRKVFRETYGISPIRYLHDFRIAKAKDILRSDYDSIEQVAESTGYSSLYHFSKMFRTYTGMSPSQYAKSARA